MVNAASVPIYRWHLCGHFSFRLHWVLIVFGFSGPCQPNETKIDNCMDNCMDNQMVIHTRLTLDEIRVCYYYFFLLTNSDKDLFEVEWKGRTLNFLLLHRILNLLKKTGAHDSRLPEKKKTQFFVYNWCMEVLFRFYFYASRIQIFKTKEVLFSYASVSLF